MIIDFATMLKSIRESDLLNIIQQSKIDPGNIIEPQEDDNMTVTTESSSNESNGANGANIGTQTTGNVNKDDEKRPPLFEDVPPIKYKKGEKEIILSDSTGNTIATMERIDVKPKS